MIIVTEDDFLNTYRIKSVGYKILQRYRHWFPVKASPKLAGIFADILCDGNMSMKKTKYGAWRSIHMTFHSKYIEDLRRFNRNLLESFGIDGRIEEVGTGRFGFSLRSLVSNSAFARVLILSGCPVNDKTSQVFNLPPWIINGNREIKTEFLRRAFSCEGSVGFDKSKGCWEIRLFSNKLETLQNYGAEYLDSFRKLLREFEVESTNVYLGKRTFRTKDKKHSIMFTFKILKPRSILNFGRFIGFDIKDKNERMQMAIEWAEKRAGSL